MLLARLPSAKWNKQMNLSSRSEVICSDNFHTGLRYLGWERRTISNLLSRGSVILRISDSDLFLGCTTALRYSSVGRKKHKNPLQGINLVKTCSLFKFEANFHLVANLNYIWDQTNRIVRVIKTKQVFRVVLLWLAVNKPRENTYKEIPYKEVDKYRCYSRSAA